MRGLLKLEGRRGGVEESWSRYFLREWYEREWYERDGQ